MLIVSLAAAPARANELPDMPKPKADATNFVERKTVFPAKPAVKERTASKSFFAVVGTLGASSAADWLTTSQTLERGNHETNGVLGPHPSNGQIAAFGAGYYAGEITLAYFVKKFGEHHHWSRHLWLIEPSYSTTVHIVNAAHNAKL